MRRPQLPRLSRPALRMPTLERLLELSGPLGFFFYLLMFVAVLAIFTGATATGVLMLVAGAAVHVVRSSAEELADQRRARAERKREVRLRSHRAARRAREAELQPSADGEPAIRVTAAQPRQRRQVSAR
jgi:hypothetical protein